MISVNEHNNAPLNCWRGCSQQTALNLKKPELLGYHYNKTFDNFLKIYVLLTISLKYRNCITSVKGEGKKIDEFHVSDPSFWNQQAKHKINSWLNEKSNCNRAKNIILFIGDGMGVSTVTSSRILRGQLNGKPGEETVLVFEDFPHVALSKVNRKVLLYYIKIKILNWMTYPTPTSPPPAR